MAKVKINTANSGTAECSIDSSPWVKCICAPLDIDAYIRTGSENVKSQGLLENGEYDILRYYDGCILINGFKITFLDDASI